MKLVPIGAKNGFWTVSEIVKTERCTRLVCICVCGALRAFAPYTFRQGNCKSCGCMRGKHRHTAPNSGGKTPTYSSWSSMIARCTQPSNPAFAHYQERGITVCDRWRDFRCFLADVGERPSMAHSLDRHPSNDAGYLPGNVRWATKTEQANNRMTNKLFLYKGCEYTLANLARETGVSKEILRKRLVRSTLPWTVEGAVNTPKQTRRESGQYC